jgi:cyclic beta-1,2-glucan synthetase
MPPIEIKLLKKIFSGMKVKINPIDDLFAALRVYFQKESLLKKYASEQAPLRSELYTTEQMEQLAKNLAASHKLDYGKAPELLLKRLADNEEVLFKVTNLLQDAVKEKTRITPAGEWLLDNFYLIEEQIRIGKRYLPKGYSKGLPRLINGPSEGFPRVYDIAIEIIAHSDGHVDINSLAHFIIAYQKISYLTIGELWAIPIMLRLALLENLRRVAARIAVDRIDENLANYWADKMISTVEKNPKNLVLIIADMARSDLPMVSAFVAAFTRKLQWKGTDLSLALSWMEQHLAEKGLTISTMVLAENQKQAADQVSMSNSIGSLRFLAKMDWREFVESMSIVEQTLCEDIDGVYTKMDFHTRDSYRHVVEKIAKKANLEESTVARIAIDIAKQKAAENIGDKRKAHVGYYLEGKGIFLTEQAANIHLSKKQILNKNILRWQRAIYIISSLIITLAVAFGMFEKAYSDGLHRNLLIVVALLSLLCATHFALAIVNWVATLFINPKQLPRMDFSKGIPEEARTLVVVPTILGDEDQVRFLAEELEVRFLANKDENLFFGLLTDFKDAKEEKTDEDEALVKIAANCINLLNTKYASPAKDIFFLFHRPRKWNNRDKIWMGYERKRGKLAELNHLLRGNAKNDFDVIIGDEKIYSTVKYVITLDTDTLLPRDAAWKLVGMMAHPLNHAVYSEKKQRIIDGYGIIQPRIAISLHGAVRSLYTRMHENDSGIDPYTRVTSDVYQDVFGEGSFIGKGIYEVDIFEKVLDKRFPENRILSHDLLEGVYTRCGFASDVQFYEEYPSRYNIDINRRHRWIRGDWQIGNWFLPFVPDAEGKLHSNPVSALSRWKIFDNLRRSLIPVALTALLLLAWTVLHAAWFWTLCVSAIVVLPSVFISLRDIVRKPDDVLFQHHFENALRATYRTILQSLFTIVCLPYETFISIDAIVRTAWRVFISHKNLLEWNPSGFVQNNYRVNLFATYANMWFAPFISIAAFIYITIDSPFTLFIAEPFLITWLFSPVIVWWLGRPLSPDRTKLDKKQILFLRNLSAKTWAFFETFVTADENWLPPDNFQQHPISVIAHRTSPTNMGLSLLANVAAYDFGYIDATQLLERTSNSLTTMLKLEKYNGHFFNWYDTQSLKTLNPRYISTVDSGNLAGHLLTLRQALLGLRDKKIIDKTVFEGLGDMIRIVREKTIAAGNEILKEFQNDFETTHHPEEINLTYIKNIVEKYAAQYSSIINYQDKKTDTETEWWLKQLDKRFKSILNEIVFFAPWLSSDIPEKFSKLKWIEKIPTLHELRIWNETLDEEIANQIIAENNSDEENKWLIGFKASLKTISQQAFQRKESIEKLSDQCASLSNMEYNFLYDKSQHLLSIGFNTDEHRCDAGYYDLLASEARLASFVAIAQGKIPQENWFALGRRLTNSNGIPVLLSWSGSMFEYLMPNLVMPEYENTLLDQTCRGTVKRQIEYGRQKNVPWGISESCYNVVDASLTYQYRAFGVPGLGFKRGLGDDLVIAPYATVMALMIDPYAACINLEKMSEDGFEGNYGFYESVDYTLSRLPRGQSQVLIQTFMVHHQGMALLSIAHLLLDKPMQKRFEAEPQFQATLLLLQEQIPKSTGYYSATTEMADIITSSADGEMRVIKTPHTSIPEVQLLSNGKYHVMITNAGGGYSKWKDISVTRWREDTLCDNWGTFCYLRDVEKDEFWSTAFQPTLKEAKNYEAVFSQGRAEFRRTDNEIETHTEIIVSPEDDIEIRRMHITNRSRTKKRIEVTSYGEVVLADAASDNTHPAFSNLFVQTEILANQHAILCTRRARSSDEQPPWMFHMMKIKNSDDARVSYETDRDKFIGRGKTIIHPQAMNNEQGLSGSQGAVLDPVVSVQYNITIGSEETVIVDMITGAAAEKNICQTMIDKYQDPHMRDRAFELSWTHSQVVLRQINATETDAQLYGKLAGSVIYTNPLLRANAGVLIKNHRGQSALWSYSISGDLPIILLQISDPENMSLVKQMIQACAYWQLKGLPVDLVIWNEDQSGYRQALQDRIQGLIAAGTGTNAGDKRGGIFVKHADQVSPEDRILMQTVARIVLADSRGTLIEQMNKKAPAKTVIPYLPFSSQNISSAISLPQTEKIFFNGHGGFSKDGTEYLIEISKDKPTPAPWANVIANPNFGTVISEIGSSYTWAENAHEFRLTPWNNDAVSDRSGEAFYLRDEKSGYFWSPMPSPACGKTPYITKHGFGYSTFQHNENGIFSEVNIYTDTEAPIKFIVIKIQNQSGKEQRLSATGYMEWVLGELRPKSVMHLVSELNNETGALFISNPYNTEFSNRITFFDTDDVIDKSFTTDRLEFTGRNGSLQNPDAMRRSGLSGKTGAGLDVCSAIRISFDIEDGKEREIIFRLGAGKNTEEASATVKRFRGSKVAVDVLQKVNDYWKKTLNTVQVETPDQSINFLSNGWLLYQVITCRLWARSGFYQSGGAFGFRDQLQDVMSLVHAAPPLAREQILLAASRQFKEGDAQHWWHPPVGRGVRTHCSDDYLWLPFAVARYVSVTGDDRILNENISFLEGRLLNANEESYYDLPNVSEQKTTLYDHCKKAIQHGFRFGSHGLPFIGSGDWNDGMNMIGKNGKGESVWLAFFLYNVLTDFAAITNSQKDIDFENECKENAAQLKNNIQKNAWDGNWYLRAFFDDGSPLGSSRNAECSIDSISQSWSVLSEGGDEKRSLRAMDSLNKNLVRNDDKIIQLLNPPFDNADIDPGYIKGYLPGVRENGGQYTHAAIWAVMAFAKLGNAERTWDLLQMINPVNHGKTADEIAVYKTEPYVMAGDVYGVEPLTGRGGWTWYTGSAGWMYQLILEHFIGLKKKGNELYFQPCLPAAWNDITVHYNYNGSVYHVNILKTQNEEKVILDNIELPEEKILLSDDKKEHQVTIKILFEKKAQAELESIAD